MKHLISLSDLGRDGIESIFAIADGLLSGGYADALRGKTVVLIFPQTSLRTRVTFEKGVYAMGGQPILFPPESLDKREELADVAGYLANWADLLIVRHKDEAMLRRLAACSPVPIVNAMTDRSHPCEILADLYALKRLGRDITKERFLFCGADGNIGHTWREASRLLGFSLEQCCAEGYEMDGVTAHHDITEATAGKDIVCTDSLPKGAAEKWEKCRVTAEALSHANEGVLFDPCPPFYRGEEVSADAIESEHFVGYGFKKNLLPVQQAVMIYSMM